MKLLSLLAILGLSLLVTAQQEDAALSFNNTQCARPDKFQSCWANATAKAASCITSTCSTTNSSCTDQFNCKTTDVKCEKSCICVAYTEWLNCAASHCWNHVYGCAYQALAIQAMDKCQLASRYPPYFPPPLGYTGHGACNCHFGEAYKAIRGYADARKTCHNNLNSMANLMPTQNATYQSECDCCAADGQLNALTQYCPARAKRLTFWNSLVPFVGLSARYSSKCATVIPTVFASASSLCAATPIGITLNATTVASQAQTTFSPLTYTVVTSVAITFKEKRQATTTLASDVLGDDNGSLTAPPSGSSFAWSLVDGIPATAVADAATTTATMSGSMSASGSSGSASAAASTSKSFAMGRNGNMIMGSGLGVSSGMVVFGVVGFVTGALALVL